MWTLALRADVLCEQALVEATGEQHREAEAGGQLGLGFESPA